MSNNRVIVIGIDGGTFDIILPMIKRGELPTLATLMAKGVSGPLRSTIPTNTGPAWVSMMTGANPGKHGIFFFLGNRHNNYRDERSLGSSDIKFPPLWSVLSKNKRRVIFVNVPFTYPPVEVNGFLISGMLIPKSAKEVSYPADIYPDLVKRLGKYEINDWHPEFLGADLSKIDLYYDELIKLMQQTTEIRKKTMLTLLKEKDWDFSMLVFTAIDRLQHLFWRFMDSTEGSHNDTRLSKFKDVIYDGYRQLDNAVGEIFEKAGKDTTTIIVSDHGFGPAKKDFFVNKWLEEMELLKIKKGRMSKKINLRVPLDRVLSKMMPEACVPSWARKIPIFWPRTIDRGKDEMVDWSKTMAYGDEFGININLKGREPYGVVNPGKEAEDLLRFVQEEFAQLTDEEESRDKIADWSIRKEEIYRGPFLEEATDLYLSVKNESYLLNAGIGPKAKFDKSLVKVVTGIHRMDGIFIINGPNFHQQDFIKPRIIDIAPTILYLMGLPVLEEMDGRVLEEIIDPAYVKLNPMKRIVSWEHGGYRPHYSPEDEEKIRESLKGLGYLS